MNEPTFTFIETQTIRSSLTTKSDGEIAALLDKPIEEIVMIIDRITGGQAAIRSEQIQKLKEDQLKKDHDKNARKQLLKEREQKIQKRSQERSKLQTHMEKRRNELDRLHSRKKFKTKEVVLSELVSVKIDHKTTVFVKPGTNIQKIKAQYTRKPIGTES